MAESGGPRAARDPEVAAGARPPLPSAGARGGARRRRGRGHRGSRSSSWRFRQALPGGRRALRAGGRGPRVALPAAVRGDMSAAGLLAPAPAPAGAPPAPEYYPEEDEELESAEDDERSCRGRESDEGASFSSLGSPGRGVGPPWEGVELHGRGAGRPLGWPEGQLQGTRLREVTPACAGQGGAPGTLYPTVMARRDLGSCCHRCPSPPTRLWLSLRSSLVGMRKRPIAYPRFS